jgi:hypothetical protein
MIYTIVRREDYLKTLAESPDGSVYKVGQGDGYPGGSVWKTYGEAAYYARTNHYQGEYLVFGVKAEWGVDTAPNPLAYWHDLLVDAELVVLE